jgi:hypothetical protein
MPYGSDGRQQQSSRPLRRRCAICGGRFHTYWPRQCHCDSCWRAWDIRWCPDGSEHKWILVGHARADMGPMEGAVIEIEECERCGVTALGGVTVEQYLAHRAWSDERKGKGTC